jgi:hypothetical protein
MHLLLAAAEAKRREGKSGLHAEVPHESIIAALAISKVHGEGVSSGMFSGSGFRSRSG